MSNASGLSHSQVQLWIGQKLSPGSPLYNMAFAFVFEGAIDPVAFRSAWRRVVDGSDALRTSIDEHLGAAVRRLRHPGQDDTAWQDFSEGANPEQDFRDWARERCTRPLPLDGPLVDSVLVKLGDDRFGWYLNQHHLVTDASSTVLLFQQVAAAYAAIIASGAAALAAPTIEPYYPLIQSLQSSADPRARRDAEEHWRKRIESDRSAPFYGTSGRTTSTRSERMTLTLDEPESRRLKEISGEAGFLSFTPDISMFALFATLLVSWLHRISGKDALGFDAPAHNRPTPGAKRSLGLFIEMFPFVVNVDAGDSFRAVGHKCLAEAYQFLRFASPGSGSRSGSTVSNVVLNFFSGAFGDFAGIPVSSEWIHSGHGDSVHALRLQVHDYDRSGRYTLHFDFNEEAFSPTRRRQAIGHFQRILAGFLEDRDQPVATVDVLTDDERDALLVRFNDTLAPPLPTRTVSALFGEQASRDGDRIALRQGSRTITFAELRRNVDAVAARLLKRGATPGAPVAVYMKRSIEAVTAILAVLRARGAYVPVDPGYPAERVRHILEDCGARLVLVDGGVDPTVVASAPAIVRLDKWLLETGSVEPTALPEPRLDDLAYIIYTSGSTGRPKGVPVEHGGLADYLDWASRQYVRGDRLTFPLFTSLAFDLTVTSLYLPLLTGGTLSVYPEPDGPIDTALMDVLGDSTVDFIKLTPSHLSLLKQMDLSASRISRMVVGGEDFKTRLAAAVSAQFGSGIEIYNEYGPTEAVVGCMIHRYNPSVDTGPSIPIGKPADHVRLYVVNEALTPVPEGVPGELCISRFGLARGYHGLEEATARQFVPHPLAHGDRLYRTGDLVRFVDRHTLEYLGRIDHQLKISGFRVEPGEIEAALLAHEAVTECVVTANRRESSPARIEVAHCERCGIASNFPGVVFDAQGLCGVCRSYESVKAHAQAYFKSMGELGAVFQDSSARRRSRYDCVMLFSGGKDSTYALCRLVDMGLAVYAFTLDNGYLSPQAKDNVRRVVESLGVDHEFATTPAMNSIFRDSLLRFSNVCNGCFKTIYTLSLNRARELGIPVIVTGLSRGQFFETRLSEHIFRDGRCSPEDVDRAVLAARKAYHRLDDQVSHSLDVSAFRDDRIFEEIQFVDFYRYCDVSLEEVLTYLQSRVPWLRPTDTGRSTNCLINDVGIYIHKKERGYHNYALPYSWDVRMGHKTRGEALEELEDKIDEARVRQILSEIGYDEERLAGAPFRAGLAAYYVASHSIPDMELRRHLAARLPAPLIPHYFKRIDAVPLTPNGKVDLAALPASATTGGSPAGHDLAPEGPVQERVAAIWQDVLRVDRVGAGSSFFELGGTSLGAMEVALRICREFDIDVPLQALFQHPTVARLASLVEDRIVEEVAGLSDEEAERLAADANTGT